MKYVIISNRLPITVRNENGTNVITRSGGGLATGLDSLETTAEKHWIGWCGSVIEDASEQEAIRRELGPMNLHPVFLSKECIERYYEGYSNSTLWPLCHYFFSHIEYDSQYWKEYRQVNQLFCEHALAVIEPGDIVWVHDYQLMLLPAMLREHVPDLGIGYFHHIPFPSYEMFRCLPERAEILKGLLGADLVGFHTHDYMRHFISTVYRVLRLHCHVDQVHMHDRITEVDAFAMGINYSLYHKTPDLPEAAEVAELLKEKNHGCKIILSVDRLDYSKGILIRLKAYADFLEAHPEYREKVILVMVVVPSRDTVPQYAELKEAIDREIGKINGRYASVGWTPVKYFYRSFPLEELCGLYHLADIALVTPLRDGMNLVAKEFLAAKGDRPGVLILSEMAGAASELDQALIVNPTDTSEIERALRAALVMTEEEQLRRLREMQDHISRQNIQQWFRDFMRELHTAKQRNQDLKRKILTSRVAGRLHKKFWEAGKRLLVLDYDGTLSPFVDDPQQAGPDRELLDLLEALCRQPGTEVHICSGRDLNTLERWFGHLNIGLTAEHGAFYREGVRWYGNHNGTEWMEELLPIFEQITARTPRSFIERKSTALVWHYREVDLWLAELRVTQLMNALMGPCSRNGLQLMNGKRIVEVKETAFTKGSALNRMLENKKYDFILAMGDDTTDEDMFAALGDKGISIKVGKFSDNARYCIPQQNLVVPVLRRITLPKSRALSNGKTRRYGSAAGNGYYRNACSKRSDQAL